MEKIEALIKLFFDEFEEVDFKEELSELRWSVQYQNLDIPTDSQLSEHLESFPKSDRIRILIRIDHRNQRVLVWDPTNQADTVQRINDFIDGIKVIQILGGGTCTFKMTITIYKGTDKQNRVSIYSFEKVVEFLKSTTLLGLFFAFKGILGDHEYIEFALQKEFQGTPVYTSIFRFVPEGFTEKIEYIKKKKRDELFDNRNEVANFLNADTYRFIPQDFFLLERSSNEDFNRVMDRLSSICALAYLCNVSSLKNKTLLKCQLNGYKKVEQEIDFNAPKLESFLEYVEIYKWVYSGGELSDKIGLARNIISLHILEKDNLLSLEKGALDSMKSSYEIYLKKNVQQYIEVKNKISEFIFDISDKICETIDDFTGTFKKNLIAFISYSISLIISNSISGGKLTDIFTVEITVISLIILLISLGFLIASILEIRKKKERLFENCEKIKERYLDILNETDLNNIFEKGINEKKERKYINVQVIKYSILWGLSILAFFLLLFLFGNWPKIS